MFEPNDIVYCTVNGGRGQLLAQLVARNGAQWDVNLYPGAPTPKIITVDETDITSINSSID